MRRQFHRPLDASRNKDSAQAMDQDSIDRLESARTVARAMGGDQAIARHQARGALTARERINLLLDEGSFRELGILARSQHPDFTNRTPADGVITGWGKIEGRTVYVSSEDATVLAGTRGRVGDAKVARIRQLALEHRRPYVALSEAGAARFQEASGAIAAAIGHRFREHFALSGKVPQVAAILGACFGGPSFTAAQSDFITLAKGRGVLGMSGPPIVKVGIGRDVTADEIGGWEKSVKLTGQVDHAGEDDAECIAAIRRYLSFFPSSAWEAAPVTAARPAAVDTPEGRTRLTALVPDNHRRGYNMRAVIELLVDGGDFFAYRPGYADNLLTGWARFDGHPVGLLASNPLHLAGAMSDRAAIKARKFIELCDAFHIPLVFLSDCPGFIVGPDVENQRMVSLAARLLNSLIAASVPIVTVVLRKAIGLAYLALGGKTMEPDALVAWPGARFNVMGPAAGVEIIHGKRIAASPDPDALRAELLAEAEEQSSAIKAAEMGLIDDVIAPAETRRVIIDTLARARRGQETGFKHRIDP